VRVQLYHGAASDVLREHVADGSIDMVYSDPPFGNNQVWTGSAGSFDDRWKWGPAAASGWEALREHSPIGAGLMAAITPRPSDRAYLGMIAELLIEVRRVLKPTGTLWLHFDDTMGAHLRVLGDVTFGPDNQLGTIIWKRSAGAASRARGFGRQHDTIACFARTKAAQWRLARIGYRELVGGDPCCRVTVQGFLDDRLNASAAERVGYPTQKPVSLLKHFVRAGTLPGDTVLDPTCGSGTALVAAQTLGRSAVGIDLSADAIAVAAARLADPAQHDLFALPAHQKAAA
jgi:DNA modification methylase